MPPANKMNRIELPKSVPLTDAEVSAQRVQQNKDDVAARFGRGLVPQGFNSAPNVDGPMTRAEALEATYLKHRMQEAEQSIPMEFVGDLPAENSYERLSRRVHEMRRVHEKIHPMKKWMKDTFRRGGMSKLAHDPYSRNSESDFVGFRAEIPRIEFSYG